MSDDWTINGKSVTFRPRGPSMRMDRSGHWEMQTDEGEWVDAGLPDWWLWEGPPSDESSSESPQGRDE